MTHGEETRDGSPTAWPHAPTHYLQDRGTFFVTAGTYQKAHHFGSRRRLALLHHELLEQAAKRKWHLEAWAVFSNHYHFVAHAPEDEGSSQSLAAWVGQVHRRTSRAINQWDQTQGRKVWHNYWESRLTFTRSYLARLKYVHQNAVKHGLVAVACDYRWCSAGWFEQAATPAQIRSLATFDVSTVKVEDDFEVYRG